MRMKRNTQWNLIKIECSKAFRTKGFWISLLIGSAIALHHTWRRFTVGNFLIGEDVVQMGAYYTGSVFGQWMGMDSEIEDELFRFLLPLLAALPYTMSYNQDYQNGYVRQIVTRGEAKKYYWAKYAAALVSGVFAVVVPLLLNFMLISLVAPIRLPVNLLTTIAPVECTMFKLYYTHPLVHLVFYLLLYGLVAAAYVSVSMVAAGIHSASFTVWAAPMITALLLNLILSPLGYYSWNPMVYLDPALGYCLRVLPTMIEIAVPVLFAVILFVRKESRREIY